MSWKNQIVFCVLVLLNVAVGSSAHNATVEHCPVRKFGDNCRFDCRCQLSTACDMEKGTCFYGCQAKYSGPGCQIAELSGSATQSQTNPTERKRICRDGRSYCSSYYYTYTTVSYAASNALTTTACAKIHSGSSRWWSLDLRADYIVTGLEFKVNRDVDVRVGPSPTTTYLYASNPLCNSAPAGTHNMTCRPARRGRYVLLAFKSIYFSTPTEICKVKVRGYKYPNYCPLRRFGPACLHHCSCMIKNERCHYVDGSCPSGCKAGMIGYGCSMDFQMTAGVQVTSADEDVMIIIPEFKHTTDGQRGPVPVTYILEIFNEVWREVEKSPYARHVMVTGLEPFTDYKARVILARRTVGNVMVRGPPGPETNFTSPCGPPARGPEIKMIETEIVNQHRYPSSVTATVMWKPISSDDTNCARVNRYELSYRRAFDDDWTEHLSAVRHTGDAVAQTQIGSLLPNTVYEFRLAAVNGPNLTTYGDVVASKTPDGIFGPVQELNVTVTSTSAHLEWEQPNDTESQGNLIGYQVKYAEYEVIACSKVLNPARTKTAGSTELVLDDLKPNRKYNVSVCALGEEVCGLETVILVETRGRAPTTKPTQAAVTGILARSARAKFDNLPCHLRMGRFARFAAQLSVDGAAVSTFHSQHIVSDLKGLSPNTRYSLRYSWVNVFGASPYSEETTFLTAVDAPGPSFISNYVSTPRIIALLWQPPVVTNGDMSEYETTCSLPGVHRMVAKQRVKNESRAKFNNTKEAGVLFHVFNGGIMPKRLYKCKVRGYTSAGPGQWSRTMNVRTDYRNNLAPTNFTAAFDDNSTSLTFHWEEPIITSGILGYKLRCHASNNTEPVVQRNVFVGQTNVTLEMDDNGKDDGLSCNLATYMPNGSGRSVSTVPE